MKDIQYLTIDYPTELGYLANQYGLSKKEMLKEVRDKGYEVKIIVQPKNVSVSDMQPGLVKEFAKDCGVSSSRMRQILKRQKWTIRADGPEYECVKKGEVVIQRYLMAYPPK